MKGHLLVLWWSQKLGMICLCKQSNVVLWLDSCWGLGKRHSCMKTGVYANLLELQGRSKDNEHHFRSLDKGFMFYFIFCYTWIALLFVVSPSWFCTCHLVTSVSFHGDLIELKIQKLLAPHFKSWGCPVASQPPRLCSHSACHLVVLWRSWGST